MPIIRKIIAVLFPLGLLTLALLAIQKQLKGQSIQGISHALSHIPPHATMLASFVTILSLLVLPAYDLLCLKAVGAVVHSRLKIIGSSLIAFSFTNALGFPLLTSTVTRMRLFGFAGIPTKTTVASVAYLTILFWIGFFSSLILSAILVPSLHELEQFKLLSPHLSIIATAITGVLLLAAFFLLRHRREITVGSFTFALPSPKNFVLAIAIGLTDWLLAALPLYILLAPVSNVSFLAIFCIFVIGQGLGVVSHIPAGIGILEGVFVASFAGEIPTSTLLAALFIYRIVYYFVPLLIGGAAMISIETYQQRLALLGGARFMSKISHSLMPSLSSVFVLIASIVLLASGATPPAQSRFDIFSSLISLPVLELSHLSSVVVGVLLFFVAQGLRLRLKQAYTLTLILLVSGAMFSLLKGFDWEEASLLIIFAILLIPARSAFTRSASLVNTALSWEWITLGCVGLAALGWLLFFGHRYTHYSNKLWWQFALDAHASRSLRAALVVAILALGYVLWRWFRPAIPVVPHITEQDHQRVAELVAKTKSTTASLALIGDKRFFFNVDKSAALMYGIEGRSAVALGEMLTDGEFDEDLIESFATYCREVGLHPVFYGVGDEALPVIVELGLKVVKLGEEAMVDLDHFVLEGKTNSSLRHTRNKAVREGVSFSIVPVEQVPAIFPELKEISDAWLGSKGAKEKGFSLGFFDYEYLKQCPFAVAKQNGQIVAFANIWSGGGSQELSVDLMRYRPDKGNFGVMDYLFVELMLWGKANKYKEFSLGMAPFSGFEGSVYFSKWSNFVNFVFRHGDHFYNFQGLRAYKEKYHPIWRPRYLACPGGLTFPVVLANVTKLISRGVKGTEL